MALGWLWWRAWTALVNGDTVALSVAGVALGNICQCFAWQAWHLATSTFVWRGRCGTYGTGLALVARLDWISRRWRRGTLRGRRGTWRHPPCFCVAGVALLALGCLWWRTWTGLVAGDARGTLRGRHGTLRHSPSFHVAGVAFGNIRLGFAWQVWHLWHWAGSGSALGLD